MHGVVAPLPTTPSLLYYLIKHIETFYVHTRIVRGTRQRNWLRYCATSRKVADSIPDEVNELFFSIYLILPATTMALEFTQPLTEWIIGSRKIMFLGSRARPARKSDIVTDVCEPTV
jgi:hypothetical protein